MHLHQYDIKANLIDNSSDNNCKHPIYHYWKYGDINDDDNEVVFILSVLLS